MHPARRSRSGPFAPRARDGDPARQAFPRLIPRGGIEGQPGGPAPYVDRLAPEAEGRYQQPSPVGACPPGARQPDPQAVARFADPCIHRPPNVGQVLNRPQPHPLSPEETVAQFLPEIYNLLWLFQNPQYGDPRNITLFQVGLEAGVPRSLRQARQYDAIGRIEIRNGFTAPIWTRNAIGESQFIPIAAGDSFVWQYAHFSQVELFSTVPIPIIDPPDAVGDVVSIVHQGRRVEAC